MSDTLADPPFLAPLRLDTDRVTVRAYRPEDGPLLNEAVNSSFEHLRTFMGWARPHTPLHDSEAWVRRAAGNYLRHEDFILGIFSPDNTRQLGGSGFHLRHGPLEGGVGEVGMWIRGDAAGQGLGTAILVALLQWGFTAWPWQRLIWRADVRNTRSARTAARAGMYHETTARRSQLEADGEMHDMDIYVALRGEWRPPA
jgi:RimJ/RimL family protein N-acetyltransferase